MRMLLEPTHLVVVCLYCLSHARGSTARNSRQASKPTDFTGPAVDTTSGLVLGVTFDVAHAFYRVRYAKPPVGNLRFKDPLPVERSADPINATYNDYLVCYQARKECSEGRCFVNLNEDCLVLNVYVPLSVDLYSDPHASPNEKLPVLFYIHGGYFHLGGGTGQRYDGRWLSNVTNSVIVTINYRLGAFGSLLSSNGEYRGNQALKDQRVAMEWVQANIAKFGGDKDAVTIFGVSAGGQSVVLHMVSQQSEPLFRRAIVQSCPNLIYRSRDQELQKTKFILEILNCTGEETKCLREASPEALVDLLPRLREKLDEVEGGNSHVQPFRPYLDGDEFSDQPIAMFRDGLWHKEKEIILGTTLEELFGRRYTPFQGDIGKETFLSLSIDSFGDKIGKAAAEKYRKMLPAGAENYNTIYERQIADVTFDCPTRALARFAVNTNATQNVYLYTSAYKPDGPGCYATNDSPSRCGHPYHASEIGVLFRSAPSFGYAFNENDTAVADQFSTYWGSFAKTGNPSEGVELPRGVSDWPAYTGEPWSSIQIQSPKEIVRNEYLKESCDFWDSMDYYVDRSAAASNWRVSLYFRVLAWLVCVFCMH